MFGYRVILTSLDGYPFEVLTRDRAQVVRWLSLRRDGYGVDVRPEYLGRRA